MECAFSHRRLDDSTSVISVHGDLELVSAPRFKEKLLGEQRAGQSRFVIDFSGVTFFDSTAVGVLVGFNRNLTASDSLAIAGASPQVIKIFELTGLDRLFHLLPTVDAALEYLQQAPLGTPEQPDHAGGPADPGEDVESQAVDEELSSGSIGLVDLHASLTEDAAVVVGIASTAMPFAQSADAQAECWLRALRRSGDAGVVLMSLGTRDDLAPGASEERARPAVQGDVVTTVVGHARLIAQARNDRAIRTNDLLGAVIEVYGPTFDRVLERHGTNTHDLIKQLAVTAPRGDRIT